MSARAHQEQTSQLGETYDIQKLARPWGLVLPTTSRTMPIEGAFGFMYYGP
jgi:hypothetical protein